MGIVITLFTKYNIKSPYDPPNRRDIVVMTNIMLIFCANTKHTKKLVEWRVKVKLL